MQLIDSQLSAVYIGQILKALQRNEVPILAAGCLLESPGASCVTCELDVCPRGCSQQSVTVLRGK